MSGNDETVDAATARSFAALSPSTREALELYRAAGQHERRGQLNEAVRLYQRAYRLEPNVEAVVRAQSGSAAAGNLVATSAPADAPTDAASTPSPPEATLDTASTDAPPDPLADLDAEQVLTMLRDLSLQPPVLAANLSRPYPIANLPKELLMTILRRLILDDPFSVEAFGETCRAHYAMARDPVLWRYACDDLLRSDTVSALDTSSTSPCPAEHDKSVDYRSRFLSLPRLRTDGVYISRCHYMRQGLSEWAFTQPTHFVVYYRFLRFYRDGTVLSLLTNNEPRNVVHAIRRRNVVGGGQGSPPRRVPPASARRGAETVATAAAINMPWEKDTHLMRGQYVLHSDNRVSMTIRGTDGRLFQYELQLKGSESWHKLQWLEYYSVRESLMTEVEEEQEKTVYPLKSLRSFIFSRVKAFLFEEVPDASGVIDVGRG